MKTIREILEKTNAVSQEDMLGFARLARNNKRKIIDCLLAEKIIAPLVLYQAIARHYRVPFIRLKISALDPDVLLSIPEMIAASYNLIAFAKDDKEIKIAALDPEQKTIFEFIKMKTGLEPKIYLTVPADIKTGLRQYRQNLKTDSGYPAGNRGTSAEAEKKSEAATANPAIMKTIDKILTYALDQGADEIQIESEDNNVIVRYQTDGDLRGTINLNKNIQSGLGVRLKTLTGFETDASRPRAGRLKITDRGYDFNSRIAFLPTPDGEKIIISPQAEKIRPLSLKQLGLRLAQQEIIKKNLEKRGGLILVTGPAASGKTTTLYTLLNLLNQKERNVSTLERPIEYRLSGINQMQINPAIGLTFSAGLNALQRQNADIIMVGEIPDRETALDAVRAGLNGRLVLAARPEADALSALFGLRDMGMPLALLTAALNLIIAQRLVKKICPHCIQGRKLTRPDAAAATFYSGRGCNQCNHSGFRGKIGLYETLEMNEKTKNIILKPALGNEIRKQLTGQNLMTTLAGDGLLKARSGVTTVAEVMRMTEE